MKQALSGATEGAILPPEERDLFDLAPEPVMFGCLNPDQAGLLFPDSELDKSDLESLLQDIPEEIRVWVQLTV